MNNEDLLAAYRQTSYWVETEALSIRIRVGEPNDLLEKLLEECHVKDWCYITAANPSSQLMSDEENQARHKELEHELNAAGCKSFPGRGIGDSGDWHPEQSFLILGIGYNQSRELGARFGQNAIVIGKLRQPAELVIPSNPDY